MKKILRFGLLPVLAGIMYLSLSSNSGGIMGKSIVGCGGSGCHAVGVGATVITITGLPANYTPGATYSLILTATNASFTASTSAAGFDLSVSGGGLTSSEPNTMVMGTEFHHTLPKALSLSSVSWNFSWTAPTAGTSATFNAAVNIVNGNGNTSGDASNLFTQTITPLTVTSPIVNTTAATNITATSATLNGIVNNNGIIPGVAISFDWGLTNAWGTNVLGTPPTATGTSNTNSSTVLTGLTPNTTYHFRVRAQSTMAITGGLDMTFKTFGLSVNSIEKLGIKVYPNPNNTGKLILENVQLKSPTFSIIALDGKSSNIVGSEINTNTYALNINNLTTGVYVLQIHSEGQIYSTKFSKQ
jgi:hypothetical protein